MSSIGQVNNRLVQTQLDSMQLGEKIATRVAVKAIDAAKMQGEAVLSLLEGAAEVAESMSENSVTSGSQIDLYA